MKTVSGERGALLQDDAARDRVAQVPRDVEHLHFGARAQKTAREFVAAHARHHEVGQQKAYLFPPFLPDLDGFLGGSYVDDCVPEELEAPFYEGPDHLVVFNQEDGLRPAEVPTARVLLRRLFRLPAQTWEVYPENGPRAVVAYGQQDVETLGQVGVMLLFTDIGVGGLDDERPPPGIMMPVRRLLKSCATPPASLPIPLHLLRLPKLLLQALVLGDVRDDPSDRRLSFVPEQLRGYDRVDPLPRHAGSVKARVKRVGILSRSSG